jgi:hypothetical protein
MDSKCVLGDGVIWVVLLRHGGHWAPPCGGGNIWAIDGHQTRHPGALPRFVITCTRRGNRKHHHNTYHLLSARNDHHTGPPFFFVQSLTFITFIPVVAQHLSLSACLSARPLGTQVHHRDAEAQLHRTQLDLRRRRGVPVRQGARPGRLRLRRRREAQAHWRRLRDQEDNEYQHQGVCARPSLLLLRSFLAPHFPC